MTGATTLPLSPLTWLRWAIFGKRVDEILSGIHRMQASLDSASRREWTRSAKKQRRAARLHLRMKQHDAAAEQAAVVRDNLHTLMTTHIKPAAAS